MNRRAVLGWTAAVGATIVAPAVGFAGYLYADAGRSNIGMLTFRNRLAIPPLLAPAIDRDGRKRFRLTLSEGQVELLPGTRTTTWGANGPILAPTLRARRGDRVAVEVTNRLAETTSIHWHGMHLPSRMDGGPHQPIAPQQTWQPYWTVEQRAATLWYHPHLHKSTAMHVYRGIAGLFIIDDDDADAVRLPSRYGVDDIPLVLQDRKIADDGRLDTSDLQFSGLTVTGLLGDKILVNGVYDPFLEVSTSRVRFRLLNGANARVFDVGFADNRAFQLVATEQGLRERPLTRTRLLLSPGERAEIVVPFAPGEQVIMRSFPPDLGANRVYGRLAGGSDTMDLVKIVSAARLAPSEQVPATLTGPLAAPAVTRADPYRITMGDFLLNDQVMDPSRVDRVVRTGSVERWEIVNGQELPHNFHIHGCVFHVVDLDGEPPPAHLLGEKDTVYVPPGATVRLVVRFLEHSDVRAPYMFHCHFLAHEDAGMMGQFLAVTKQDASMVPDALPTHARHGG